MADHEPRRDRPLTPDEVARHSFTVSRRGFEQLEVRALLTEVAADLAGAVDREAELRRRVEDAERRATSSEEVDDHQLMTMLGEETARVLEAARQAANEIRAKAEANVARLVRDAQDQASEIRRHADSELLRRTEEAEQVAAHIREQAEEIRNLAADAADAEIEAARQRGREMVAEAQIVRERVLRDLARRRKAVRQQIEQLRAGRDRLMTAYDVVRQTVDQATQELMVAVPEAKLAAELAGRSASVEAEPTIEELEDEIAEKRAVQAPLPVGARPAIGESAQPPPVEEEPEQAVEPAVLPEQPEEPSEPVDVPTPPPPGTPTFHNVRIISVPPAPTDADADPDAGADADTGIEPDLGHEGIDDEAVEPTTPEPAQGPRRDLAADVSPVPVDAEPEPVAETEPEPVVTAPPERGRVDELFARIRASRSDTMARAHEVLDDEPASPSVSVPATVEANGSATGTATTTERLLERRDAAVDEVEQGLARRLKRALADEQNEVLDTLRRAPSPTPDRVLPSPDDHADRYAAAAAADLTTAARAGSAFLGSNGAGPSTVDDLAAELAGVLVGLLRERVLRCFSESATHPDELAEQVRACYREWKTQRIGDTARHYVLAAFNRGLFDATPRDARLCWVVDNGGTPCPDADDNALAGPVAKGLPFPTGHPYPPAHPGCRCLAIPEHQ